MQEVIDATAKAEDGGEHLTEDQVQILAKMLMLQQSRLTAKSYGSGLGSIGITRRDKEESKKHRKMAKASRRINRH